MTQRHSAPPTLGSMMLRFFPEEGLDGCSRIAREVASFKAGFAGVALTPDDDGYDEARALWNGSVRQAARRDRAMPDDEGRGRGRSVRS